MPLARDPQPPPPAPRPTEPETVEVLAPAGRPDRRGARDDEFTAFMSAHADALLRTAWLLCGDAHRAEELTQQALVRMYASWGRAGRGDELAYARRILVNLRIDTWRRRRREVLSAPEDLPEVTAPDEHTSTHDRDQLIRALALLSPRQRRVVVLRHLVGLPEAEVAADLGVSLGTVKSTASRGLGVLRAALSEPTTEGSRR
ncbi:DNA-directed RNA polymerase sigma-70 factor [Cellulomonas chitinilytica]|uniref:DNA-directed RNA polymerase sigma-70 factor n=1 Tax=Cellulomonas chitinilytica TaxID=398759 RepID=A0A919U190_9CELL|nr:SigE family RNA polymerase sigma factor [Cellulomonas chitinilytica]GIG19914.1 DNA-directed RNA polymerase sigma-70 factor [Cellulomonas chitinilytica]